MHLKLLQKEQPKKTAEATGDFTCDKIAHKTAKFSKLSHQNIQKQLQMSMIKKYLKKYISLEERWKIIDYL